MKAALAEAKKAYMIDEVPVGAVIVYNDKIIARGHNTRELKQSVLGHAEINAINKASKKIGSWRLEDCDMYVTLEPCSMCSGAIIGILIFYTNPETMVNVNNFWIAIGVGASSGASATGTNQIIKQLFSVEEKDE